MQVVGKSDHFSFPKKKKDGKRCKGHKTRNKWFADDLMFSNLIHHTQHADTLVGWWCVRSIVMWVSSWVVAVRPGWSWKQWSVVLLWNIDVQEATRPVGSRPPPITGWPGQLAANRRSGWRHGQRPQTSWSEVSQPGPRIRRLRTNGGPGSVSEANIAGGRACEHCGPRDHEPWSATWLL